MRRAPVVDVVGDLGALAEAAAVLFVQRAQRAVSATGRFRVALSGGTTPTALYRLLATHYHDALPWHAMHCFWGDERHVPPTHADSNFRAANEAMLGRVPVPPGQVHRMLGELRSASAAAAEYEATLRSSFGLAEGVVPAFDLVLLGMGEDGHTASLFPHSAALHERDRLVLAPWVDRLNSYRITLSVPVLNRAASVLFMVSGAAKAEALHAVLEGPQRLDDLPAQAIAPAEGEVRWLIDADAAGRLSTPQRR